MNEIYPGTDLSCSKILNDYFYCNICFNCPENNFKTFNGNNYSINSNNPIEITREFINLLKNMTMGGEEFELFLLKYPIFNNDCKYIKITIFCLITMNIKSQENLIDFSSKKNNRLDDY